MRFMGWADAYKRESSEMMISWVRHAEGGNHNIVLAEDSYV